MSDIHSSSDIVQAIERVETGLAKAELMIRNRLVVPVQADVQSDLAKVDAPATNATATGVVAKVKAFAVKHKWLLISVIGALISIGLTAL